MEPLGTKGQSPRDIPSPSGTLFFCPLSPVFFSLLHLFRLLCWPCASLWMEMLLARIGLGPGDAWFWGDGWIKPSVYGPCLESSAVSRWNPRQILAFVLGSSSSGVLEGAAFWQVCL